MTPSPETTPSPSPETTPSPSPETMPSPSPETTPSTSTGPSREPDRGAVTVLAATAVGVTALLLALGLALGATVLARHRVEHAADLAALAAAADAVRGRDVACERAGELAAANGARLVGCRWSGWVVEVHVEVSCGCMPSVADSVGGRAKAGPSVTSITSDAASVGTKRYRSVAPPR